MSKIAIVTDSTAYIPKEVGADFDIHVTPLQLIWGEEQFRDGVDILPADFYQRLETSKTMPTTSQPSPQAFYDVYSKLAKENYDILSIHISTKLSGTVGSAEQAKAFIKDIERKTKHICPVERELRKLKALIG